MKKKISAVLLAIVALFFVGCTKDFEFGSDKFYLEKILDGGQNSVWYYFCKKVDSDMVMDLLSDSNPYGYELVTSHIMGYIGNITIEDKNKDPYISVGFCCYYKAGMGKEKVKVQFNYTVKSTMERKEEVWELDFGQEPHEDLRK